MGMRPAVQQARQQKCSQVAVVAEHVDSSASPKVDVKGSRAGLLKLLLIPVPLLAVSGGMARRAAVAVRGGAESPSQPAKRC